MDILFLEHYHFDKTLRSYYQQYYEHLQVCAENPPKVDRFLLLKIQMMMALHKTET